MTIQFNKLRVWDDNTVSSNLQWYHAVSTNAKPAKFLICKFIEVAFETNTTTAELWQRHSNATKEFLLLQDKIRLNQIDLINLTVPKQSLLDLNITIVNRMLSKCNFCRWNCKVDRLIVDDSINAKTGTCQLGKKSRVSTYFHHRGEELVFRGSHGSGTIFFTSCNLRCVFCQNGDISKDKENGITIEPVDLAKIAVLLRYEGVHNINYVGGDPIVHLHTIIESIEKLDHFDFSPDELRRISFVKSDRYMPFHINPENGNYKGHFNVPLLWNSNFFMSDDAMKILRTVIDIWLPDFKFGNNSCARRLARTPWYFETVSKTHKKLIDWNEDFVIRHLIMPNHVECCTKPIIDWIKRNMPNVLINMMDQYHPDVYAKPSNKEYNDRYKDISIFPSKEEITKAYSYACENNINFQEITFERSKRNIH